jgi:hypothetical protein
MEMVAAHSEEDGWLNVIPYSMLDRPLNVDPWLRMEAQDLELFVAF